MDAKPPIKKKGSKANWLNKILRKRNKITSRRISKTTILVIENGYKLILTFDGRDAAGKVVSLKE